MSDIRGAEFNSGNIQNVPPVPGLYAWYYRPRVPRAERTSRELARLFTPEAKFKATVSSRYGLRLTGTGPLQAQYGGLAGHDLMQDLLSSGGEEVLRFLKSPAVVAFTRPIYVGIAKDLHARIVDQHWDSIISLWDAMSNLSIYLSGREQPPTIQESLDDLNEKFSFPWAVRVLDIAPGNLIVRIQPTQFHEEIGPDVEPGSPEETEVRRTIERVLHFVTDPVCGRA